MISNTLITYVDFPFSKIPGNSRDWDPTLFGKNPMGFKIPGIGIFFRGIGISHEKATSAYYHLPVYSF